jgi:lipopolysaccharide biosynthesis glycosyltransferase
MVMNDVDLKEASIEKLRKETLPSSKANIEYIALVKDRMLSNHDPLYGKSDTELDLILHHVRQRFLKVKSKRDVICDGKKNLLYFSIFFNDEYIELLYICLKSIVSNTPKINFDILFITDEKTRQKIKSFDVISKFKVDYMIYNSVDSGPAASLKKLNIFDYKKISKYSKILFFDTDIVCIKDVSKIFDMSFDCETLYVCYPPIYKSPTLLSATHSIMYMSRHDAEFLVDNPNTKPFNAGQFLFLNSNRMKEHFDNVRWLKDTWPCPYFYEQSFMNYYFAFRGLTKPMYNKHDDSFGELEQVVSVLHDQKNVVPKNSMPEKIHGNQTVAIHFAAVGIGKKAYIDYYTNAYKLHI